MSRHSLPIPPFFDPGKLDQVWRVPYEQRAQDARSWAEQHRIHPAAEDDFRLALILVDVQNTFCIPDFELFVGGRSGSGAVEDNRRLAEFIYTNLGAITRIVATLDTHRALQIFHSLFLVDQQGSHPPPMTSVSADDIAQGRWQFNPDVGQSLGLDAAQGQAHLRHYVEQLQARGKYDLTVWPYHAMLGGIGHAMVSAIEEAVFFHTVARQVQTEFVVKGEQPLTEHYSAVGPEVTEGPEGKPLGQRSGRFLELVETFDAVIFAGQAKSHCVAWTVADTLDDIHARDPKLADKVYLLEDCCSSVVVPDVVDFTDLADQAFAGFAEAGMHPVRSMEPLGSWPGPIAQALS